MALEFVSLTATRSSKVLRANWSEVDVTVPGFRSSFRDWASECTGFTYKASEMALILTKSIKTDAA